MNQPPPEQLGHAQAAQFTNGSFETGVAGQPPPAPWVVTDFLNPNPGGVTIQTPQTYAGLNLVTQGMTCKTNNDCDAAEFGTCQGGFCKPTALTTIIAGTGTPDPLVGNGLTYCRYGKQCAIINNGGHLSNVNQLSQTMTVTASDVDPSDGKVHIRMVVAPVLEDPGHPPNEEPYFFVQITNASQANAVLYSNYNFANQAGVPWQTAMNGGNTYRYTDWQLVDVAPGAPAINMGDMIALQLVAAGCSIGGHIGELYVDGVGTVIPGLFVTGTAATQVNPGANLTYSLAVNNGSPSTACTTSTDCPDNTEACVGGVCAETGVTVTFTTPPGTVYESFTAPTGAMCTSSAAAGNPATITCTFTGPVPPGAAGTIQVTVMVDATTTGTINEGNYAVSSTQEGALLGNVIVTNVGCTGDAQCPAGDWCFESKNECTPTLANSTPLPTDPNHQNPTATINGMCNATAGMIVCTSGVCDGTECGYANGDGPCTAGGAVCRSGICDSTDDKCGYANGDGPCTTADGPADCRSMVCDPTDGLCGLANGDGPCVPGATVVCRSGMCSTNKTCEPAGGCNVDADCTAGKWCNETAHTCVPKLANGQPLPSDPAHTKPTVNGMCSSGEAPLVCVSGVCDSSNQECGYANGDGPCVPGVGTLCQSNVCDTDALCGYKNGDGPCTPGSTGNGSVVCRSGMCSVNGTCEAAGGCNVDADCAAGTWCNETAHMCAPTVANGQPIPTDGDHTNPTLNGSCTTAAAMLTCTSGVCDTSDMLCGYANGDGPCTPGTSTVCRSGFCSANGTCGPAGGCNVDADCTTGKWCNETAHMCMPTVANGQPIPTDGDHQDPTLNGSCTPAAAMLTCTSGVCDTNDMLCGYANGDGPCTPGAGGNGGVVCRSGACSTNGTCEPTGGCNVDADCTAGNWCNETKHTCTPTAANGQPVGNDPAHTNPTLNGSCTPAAAMLTCTSTVCDTKDMLCGIANGDPCPTGTTGNAECRSGICSTSGVCVGCTMDSQCPAATPICDTSNGACVQCLNSTQCSSDTPICNTTSDTCVACNGDNGSGATEACPTAGNPFCFLTGSQMGSCGKCTTNSDCTGHAGGTICDTTSGACTTGCTSDAQCSTNQWCNAVAPASGTCVPKLPNGTPLPTTPSSVSMCTSAVGARVCISGVCDPKDNECGLAPGDGKCENANQCRNDTCNTATMTCTTAGCTSDSGCPSTDFCNTTSSMCSPKQPDGSACTGADQCTSGVCAQEVCGGAIIGSGGLLCAAHPEQPERGSSGGGAAGFGLLLAAAGLSRRRRR